jgi:hypothetical protein
VIKNDDVTINKIGTSIKATSVKYEFAIAHLLNFYPRKQSKMHDCLNVRIIIFSTILFVDRSISSSAQTIRERDYEAVVIIYLYNVIAIISRFFERL